jgi:hypothetical protein
MIKTSAFLNSFYSDLKIKAMVGYWQDAGGAMPVPHAAPALK